MAAIGSDAQELDRQVAFPPDRDIAERGIEAMMRLCLGGPDTLPLDTPARVVRAFKEMTEGYSVNVEALFKRFDNVGNTMVVFDGLRFTSLCEHHLMPFTGTASIGYVPKDGQVLGASKSARILEAYAKRFQLQERLGEQVADAFVEHLTPDVVVLLRAKHACMGCRGARQPDADMVTCTIRGGFNKPEVRAEFYSQIRG
jgi:GTP cyclohydrolase IA